MTPPAITIGIMTHNYGRYVREAVDSVLAQTRAEWELVISDDASTDGTAEIVRPYLRDPRVSYVRHEKSLGQSANWGYLLGRGTAPLLAVLHADDQWLPGTLEAVLPAFAADPELDLLYGNWWRQVEGQEGRTLGKREKPHALSGHGEYRYQVSRHTWLPSATFLSRRAADLAGRPDSELTMLQDTEYFLRACLHSRRACALSEPLMVYRVHRGSATAEGQEAGRTALEKELLADVCARHATPHPARRHSLRILRRHLALSIFSEGVTAAVQGRLKPGRQLMKRGVRLCPSLLTHPKVLADCLLCSFGDLAGALLRRLHRRRLGEAVETA